MKQPCLSHTSVLRAAQALRPPFKSEAILVPGANKGETGQDEGYSETSSQNGAPEQAGSISISWGACGKCRSPAYWI